MKRCYCISGLGADRRAFQKLDFDVELLHIDWEAPLENESFEAYCLRLSRQIDRSQPFLLLGLSFGGMVACEIAKTLKPEKTILISSSTDNYSLPPLFRWMGKINLHKVILSIVVKPPMFMAHWLFGTTADESRRMLTIIINESDPLFIKWAIDKVLKMKPIPEPNNLIRIHGSKDRLFAAPNLPNTYVIKGGSHFMVIEMADEVNKILREVI